MAKFNMKKGKSGGGSIKDKFQKKDQDTLQKAWEERDKRSKSSSSGKSIYNEERMEEYGITEIKYTQEGEYYFVVLPISFSNDVPYFDPVSIHKNVGIDNDEYICMAIYDDNGSCHRCNVQKQDWKKYDKTDPKIKAQLVAMYPTDRCIYLVYDLTDKFLKDEDTDPVIRIWNAPKKDSAHERLQDIVRDKKTQRIIDISDLDEGKIVYMKVTIKEVKPDPSKGIRGGKFPQYGSFDLLDRDDDIPEEVLEQLDKLITDAKEEGQNAIQYLLHFPDDEEIAEAMKTEVFDTGEEEEPPVKSDKKKFSKKEKKDPDSLREKLESMSKIKLKMWCKDKNLWDEIVDDSLDQEEMIEAIMEFYESGGDIPF